MTLEVGLWIAAQLVGGLTVAIIVWASIAAFLKSYEKPGPEDPQVGDVWEDVDGRQMVILVIAEPEIHLCRWIEDPDVGHYLGVWVESFRTFHRRVDAHEREFKLRLDQNALRQQVAKLKQQGRRSNAT